MRCVGSDQASIEVKACTLPLAVLSDANVSAPFLPDLKAH
jgi:hypothetical protein